MDSSSLHRRAFAVTTFFVLAFSALSARIVYVQVVQHDHYSGIAKAERMEREYLPAKRGGISDRHGEALVQNKHVCDIVTDRNHLIDIHVCRRAVARARGLNVSKVAERFDDDEVRREFVTLADAAIAEFLGEGVVSVGSVIAEESKVRAVIARELPFDRAEGIRVGLRERRIGGFRFEESMGRHYPNPGRLAQVLGITDADNIGREGIEGALDEFLAGEAGEQMVERTRRSSELPSKNAVKTPARDGSDVELTIDMGLQNIVEGVLEGAVAEYSPEKIMAVFMNPMTGEILAMASRPHFDQSTRVGARKVHPISDRYEPGSTFKIITLAAAFDQGHVTSDSMFFCHNGRYQEGRHLRLDDHHPYSYLSAEKILAKSSNIGAYLMAKQVGRHTFYSYIKDFGFGATTQLALTGEVGGLVTKPDTGRWSATSLSRMAMGYEVDVTALQMVNALSAIANGGDLMKPQIVRRVTSAADEVLYQFAPRKIRRAVSESAANQVRRALMAVVAEGGTGGGAAIEGFAVAGKTGTAQKPKEDRSQGYYKGRYVVSFMGFLPAENPALAGIIVVDDPQNEAGRRYGGTVAAPLFAEIAAAAMPYMGIKPTVVPRRAARAVRKVGASRTY